MKNKVMICEMFNVFISKHNDPPLKFILFLIPKLPAPRGERLGNVEVLACLAARSPCGAGLAERGLSMQEKFDN